MKNIPIKFLLSRCEDTRWDLDMFSKTLHAGNALISVLPDDGYTRYEKHQRFNRLMHRMRAKALGVDVVIGFFPIGAAEELSLFGDEYSSREVEPFEYPLEKSDGQFPVNGFAIDRSTMIYWADWTGTVEGLVIGWGCADLRCELVAQWDLGTTIDWGWRDGYGEHIQKYDADRKIYTRKSMSARHCYDLAIADDGKVTIE